MQHLVDTVIAAIRSENPTEIRELLLEARLFIEKSVGTWGSWMGISRSVDDAEPSEQKLLDLKAALLGFAKEYREHLDVGSAIWALGAFRDESLRGFFLNEMRFHLQARRHHPVSQAHSALLDLGDDAVIYEYAPGETSHEKYFEAVGAYLDGRGA
jgi:hypothetical protein